MNILSLAALAISLTVLSSAANAEYSEQELKFIKVVKEYKERLESRVSIQQPAREWTEEELAMMSTSFRAHAEKHGRSTNKSGTRWTEPNLLKIYNNFRKSKNGELKVLSGDTLEHNYKGKKIIKTHYCLVGKRSNGDHYVVSANTGKYAG